MPLSICVCTVDTGSLRSISMYSRIQKKRLARSVSSIMLDMNRPQHSELEEVYNVLDLLIKVLNKFRVFREKGMMLFLLRTAYPLRDKALQKHAKIGHLPVVCFLPVKSANHTKLRPKNTGKPLCTKRILATDSNTTHNRREEAIRCASQRYTPSCPPSSTAP